MPCWKIAVLLVLTSVLSVGPLFAATLTECFDATCVMISAPEYVPSGDDFEIEVEGYVEDASSWDVTAYMLLENAAWSYAAETHMVETPGPILDSKGFNWGGSYAQKYTLKKGPGTDRLTFVFGQRSWGHDFYDVAVETRVLAALPVKQVSFDIKPGSCPNPFNVNKKGVLSAAIVGSADFDVARVDLSSVRVAGVSPIHTSYGDVTEPHRAATEQLSGADCRPVGPDGYQDLTLKFKAQDIYAAVLALKARPLKDGETLQLQMTADLSVSGDGSPQMPIAGVDVVRIITKK